MGARAQISSSSLPSSPTVCKTRRRGNPIYFPVHLTAAKPWQKLTVVPVEWKFLRQLETVLYIERRDSLSAETELSICRPVSCVDRCSELQSCRNVFRVHHLQQPRLGQHYFTSCNANSTSYDGVLPSRPELPHTDLRIVVGSQRKNRL